MVICTPFDKPGCFYFNQKINCMRARGQVRLGEKTYVFDPADSFGVLDWGRGCGPITTPGIGAAPPGRVTACPSDGTSAMASAIPPPPARTCCFTAARPTSSARCGSISPSGREGTTSCPPGALPPTTAVRDEVCPHSGPAACTDVKLIKSDQHQVFGASPERPHWTTEP